MEEAIAIIISIIAILLANWQIRKWKKEAATAYFIIGQKATTSDEREWAYCKAFKYGHPKAKLFYIYAAANTFSGRKPSTPFTIATHKGNTTAIFYDYYIRVKHLPYASNIQQEITQRVLELKDGLNPSSDLYSEAREASPKDIITIPISMRSNTLTHVAANIAVTTATLLNHPQT